MTRLVPAALLAACALIGAGCGDAANTGPATSVTITHDFGAVVQSGAKSVPATPGLTGLRQLETVHKVTTAYGGRYVKSIDGTTEDADSSWLFYVDGIESDMGSTSVRLKPGQVVQWDFHAWQAVRTGGAIVGAYPLPLKTQGVKLICAPRGSKACKLSRKGLTASGIVISPHSPVRIVVGPWNDIEGFDGVPDLTRPGDTNGAFAQFSNSGEKLTPVSADGSDGHPLTDQAGLLVAFSSAGKTTWIATGTDDAGTEKAAGLLDSGGPLLKNRFAYAIGEPGPIALPEVAGP
jgi:hypothetical protein